MIDPRTVMLAVPAYDHKIPCEMAGFLISCANRFFSAVSFKQGVSTISLARNLIAESFLQSTFEWLICLDADIIASPQDFLFLMEAMPGRDQGFDPTITTVECTMITGTVDKATGQRETFKANADAIVTAEYSYKDDSLRPCRYGLGFTRIHRSVFEKLRELKHDDGSPRLWSTMYAGRLMTDFFPAGPFISQVVPNGEWKGEDIGFFTLCGLAGIVPRVETRTRLWHVGTKAYPYMGQEEQSGAN